MTSTPKHNAADLKKDFPHMSDIDFLDRLRAYAKFKDRSHKTHHQIHVPELIARLQLDAPATPPAKYAFPPDVFIQNLSNTSPINVVYLGNSMLERFKTTGAGTNIGKLGETGSAWNAGVGGDKNESVAYRLTEGLYDMLKTATKDRCDIKVWVLASGTNNLHVKRSFRKQDVESWRVLVEACLRIAPRSTVLACDMAYRKDIPDDFVNESNGMLKEVVEEMNKTLRIGETEKEDGTQGDEHQGDRVKWVESRHVIGKDMLDDHVHLNEEGYRVWDAALWPLVAEILSVSTKEDD